MTIMRFVTAAALIAVLAAPALADATPSIKNGVDEIGRAVKDGVKNGYDKTKDATLNGVGKALDATGKGIDHAGQAVEGAGQKVDEKRNSDGE
jgi:hypothetical protein